MSETGDNSIGDKIVERELPAGTVVKIQGLPFELKEPVKVSSSYGNFQLIQYEQQ